MMVSSPTDSRCRRMLRRFPENCSSRAHADVESFLLADQFRPFLPPPLRKSSARSREEIDMHTNTIDDQDAVAIAPTQLCSREPHQWHKATRSCRRTAGKLYHMPFFAYLLCLLLFRTTSTFMGPQSSIFFAKAEAASAIAEDLNRDLQFGLRPNSNRMQYCSHLAFQLCTECRDSTKKLVRKGKCSTQKKRRKCKAKFKGCLKPRNPGMRQSIARKFEQHCDNRLLVKKPNVFAHSTRGRRGRSRFDYRKMSLKDWCPAPNLRARRNNGGGGGPIARDNCGKEVEYFAELELELDLYCPIDALRQPEIPQNERTLMEAGLVEYLNTESACENIVENQGDECEQIIFETATITQVIVGEDCRPFYERQGIPFPDRRLQSENNHRALQRRRKTRVKKRTSGRCRTRKKKCRRKEKRRFLRASFDTKHGFTLLSEDTSNVQSMIAVDARGLQATVPLPSPAECAQNTITESIVAQDPIAFQQIVNDEEISFVEDIPCGPFSDDCLSNFRCCSSAGCKCDVGSETSCNVGTTFGEEVTQCYLNKNGLPGTISSIQDNLCCDIDPGPPFTYRYECAEGLCDPLPVATCSSQDWIVKVVQAPGEGTFGIEVLIDIFGICSETLSNMNNAQSLLQSTMKQFFRNAIEFAGCNAFVQITTVQVLSMDTNGCGVDESQQLCINPNNGQRESCVVVRARIDGIYTNGLSPNKFPETIFYEDVASARRLENVGSVGTSRRLETVEYPLCDYLQQTAFPDAATCINQENELVAFTLFTTLPTSEPSISPSSRPSSSPAESPTASPSSNPSAGPSSLPSTDPTESSEMPSSNPSSYPSVPPSRHPSQGPSSLPSTIPSLLPSSVPSSSPSLLPSLQPSERPSTCDDGTGVGSCEELKTRILNATNSSSRAEIELCNDIICYHDLDMTGTYFRLSCRHPPCEVDLNGNGFVTQWNNGTGSDFYAIFEDLTITGGDVTNRNKTHQISGEKKRGGAISAFGNENITSCIELINTTIRDSCAPTGGAMHLWDCNFVMRDSTCLNNTAKDGRGGCLRVAGFGNSTIDDCQFQYNCAEESGGALYYLNGIYESPEEAGVHMISNSLFADNEVKSSNSTGGAISMISPGEYSFTNVEFRDNSAGAVGGALYFSEYPNYERRRRLESPTSIPTSEPPTSFPSPPTQPPTQPPTRIPTGTPPPTSFPSPPTQPPTSFPSPPTPPPTRIPKGTQPPTSIPTATATATFRPSRMPSVSPSDVPSNQPSTSPPPFGAHFIGAKFVDNVARGESYLAAGFDIYIEGLDDCDGECGLYIEITCDNSTEFCDACNSTDFTSTNYPPNLVCTNSKTGPEICLGDGCNVTMDTCSSVYLISTNVTCGVVPDSPSDKCCIANGAPCLGNDGLPFDENCCGAYSSCDGVCVVPE